MALAHTYDVAVATIRLVMIIFYIISIIQVYFYIKKHLPDHLCMFFKLLLPLAAYIPVYDVLLSYSFSNYNENIKELNYKIQSLEKQINLEISNKNIIKQVEDLIIPIPQR
jgi:hypothetical protein